MSESTTSAHTCSELRAALLSGEEPDWARVHLETCAGCRELWDPPLRDALTDAAKHAPEALDLKSLQREIAQEVDRDRRGLRRLKSLGTSSRVGIALLVVTALIGVNLLAPRPDLEGLGWIALTAPPVVALTLLLLGVRIALRGPHLTPSSHSLTRAVIGLSAGLPLVYFLSRYFLGEVPLVDSDPGFARRTLGCFLFGVGSSLPLGIALLLLDRNRLAPLGAILCAGAAGGLSGLIALHLHCPHQHPAHLSLGHFSVLVLMLCAGLLVRGRFRTAPLARQPQRK